MTLLVQISFFLLLTFSLNAAERLVKLDEPKELSSEAIIKDWTRFNGLGDDAKSLESPLLKNWPENGPRLIWSLEKGEGYASPAVVGDLLILFHRLDGKEIVEARKAVSGDPVWEYSYPVDYQDRYGYSAGPRASPVVCDGLVYIHGVTAWLSCLEVKTGKLVWRRDLAREYDVPRYFFGKGSNPIVSGNVLVLNLGGGGGQCMAGFDRTSGKTLWILKDEWGASYSSPTLATIHDQQVCLAHTGGESKPATGGLLIFNPETGKRLVRFPWRSRKYESATACPPIYLGDNHVFISECYDKGSVVLRIAEDFTHEIVWENPKIGIHWMTPIEVDGYLYGVSGRHQQGAVVFCVNWRSGEVIWQEPVGWQMEIDGRSIHLQLFRASLLYAEKKFLCLSEFGSLVRANFSPKGWKIEQRAQLFFCPEAWTLPALSCGLLYVMQNGTDRMSGLPPRLLCYDFRGS